MAERYAVATGNWSALATWDGGASLPGSGDDVHANGFTVTINQNVTVLSLRTTAGATAVAGGGFVVSGNRLITCASTGIVAGASNCLTISSAITVTIASNVLGGSASSIAGVFQNHSSSVSTLTGSITGGSAANAYGFSHSNGTTVINGDIIGGSAATSAWGALFGSNVTVNGNGIGGSSTSEGIRATGALTINGNAVASSTAAGVSCNASATVTVNGLAIASSAKAGLVNVHATGVPKVVGMEHATNGQAPVTGKVFVVNAGRTTCKVYQSDGSTNTILDAPGDLPVSYSHRIGRG